jgi:hypothetical protein
MPVPFRRLLNCQDAREPLAGWEQAFGQDFASVRPFLSPCTGQRTSVYPCPDDPAVRLTVQECHGEYCAFSTGELTGYYDDLVLKWEEVQVHRFDPQAFIDFIRGCFGMQAGSFQSLEKLHCIGVCAASGSARSVYASFATGEAQALSEVSALSDSEIAGCIFFPQRYPAVESFLRCRGISSVFLDEACSSNPPGCPQSCRQLQEDISNREMKQHLDTRFDTFGHEYTRLKAENEQLKGQLAQVIANIARQVDSEYFKWIYMILASGSVSKAAAALKIPNSSFAKRLKTCAARGGLYRMLFDLTAVRKGCGIKSIEGYNPEFAGHQAAALQTTDAVQELLDGLEALNAANWQKLRDELIELVRSDFG